MQGLGIFNEESERAVLGSILKDEKEKIKSWHRSGAGGREIIQAHTSLVDEDIRHVLLSMTQLEVYAEANVLDDFALIAVGGYGRGELNPLSDIDLLFLLIAKTQPTTETFIKDVLSVIWGFVSLECRSAFLAYLFGCLASMLIKSFLRPDCMLIRLASNVGAVSLHFP